MAITVHDPRGYAPKVVGKRLAPRLSALDGKTIYLVDCLFDNTDVFILPQAPHSELRPPMIRVDGRRSRSRGLGATAGGENLDCNPHIERVGSAPM